MFLLAQQWHWSPHDVRTMPISRRNRAIRWINELLRDQKARSENAEVGATFGKPEFIDYVWGPDVAGYSEDIE